MQHLTASALRATLARGDASEPPPLLLDVREPWELALASIRHDGLETLHLPMNDVPDRLDALDPARTIVCLCHHGVRSAHVAAFLERQGFADVANLVGGIDAWSAEVDPTVPRY